MIRPPKSQPQEIPAEKLQENIAAKKEAQEQVKMSEFISREEYQELTKMSAEGAGIELVSKMFQGCVTSPGTSWIPSSILYYG